MKIKEFIKKKKNEIKEFEEYYWKYHAEDIKLNDNEWEEEFIHIKNILQKE
jgi:predicted CopG family antitoxin